MFDVSIIIPVYNVEEYVSECLRSVMEQSADCSVECLIIDDCGIDRSMEVVKETLQSYNGPITFRIIKHHENGGLSAARNTGIKNALGKYVYFLDSDDIITPDCIAFLYSRAKQYPTAEIIVGDFQTFPQKDIHKFLSLQGKNFPDFNDDIKWIRSIFLTTFPVTAWNKFIKKDFIEKNNLYFREGILHEDNHWMANSYHSVSSVAFVNSITYLYRMREGSITQNSHANVRKLENLGIIYTEMFSKPVRWDRPWAEWVLSSLDSLCHNSIFQSQRSIAIQLRKSLMAIIVKNPNVPIIIRLLVLYYKQPKHKGQQRIFYALFTRYLKTLE